MARERRLVGIALMSVVLATLMGGRADPTFGGRTTIIDHTEPLQQSCWVVATDGSPLTGSLIGYGERPLTG